VSADGRVLVVDLDAHEGNGTAAVFHDWDWASEDDPLPVASGLTGGMYLGIVRDTLPGALNAVRLDLVVYTIVALVFLPLRVMSGVPST
jgi:histone deacetylase 11